ncbi:kinase-like domain-containing protein [Suillus paluster]|uniref:kinase-like domain-containing protein n=1 Tax=Suillus paluster TaxID=48578 RepID=UPI001B86D22F|nr:kinase-like domain-containing protein [Suillus paluster]KAG1743658.1 kinase-like domain-containing protein [Suillus paluster]
MSQPGTENPPSTKIHWMKRLHSLRVDCSLSFTSEGATSSGNDSDESKTVPDLTGSCTDSESPFIVSPSGPFSSSEDISLSTFEFLDYKDEFPSSLTPPYATRDVDFKKYHDEPLDLTPYIKRTQGYHHNSGGYSNVWKCKLDSFHRNGTEMPPQDVAVKAFKVSSRKPEDINKLIKKLRQEVFIWQALECSHILPLYGTTKGYEEIPALVCPWMKNGTLHEHLNEMWGKQLLPKMHCLFLLVFGIVSDFLYLGSATHSDYQQRSVHAKKIIHGDLTAYNVLIDENGHAVLADFGLSLLLAKHETSFFNSHSSGIKPNKASDIYSFGCIMMQVLSNNLPYFGIREEAVIIAKSKHTPPKRPTLHPIDDVYWRYLERCWSPRVERRPLVDDVLDYIKAEYDKQKLAS